MQIDMIAFDADDTLWHSENLYAHAHAEFQALVARHADAQTAEQVLHQTELRNLPMYGYGIKGFTLSMIESALALSEQQIAGGEIERLLDIGKRMLASDVELLDGATQVIAGLAETYPLMLITKGDLIHQQAKIGSSGLRQYFRSVEVVGDKTAETYVELLNRHCIDPSHFIMIGNFLRSDILPVLAIGGQAVHVPYAITWAHELVEIPAALRGRYHEIQRLIDLPELIRRLARS